MLETYIKMLEENGIEIPEVKYQFTDHLSQFSIHHYSTGQSGGTIGIPYGKSPYFDMSQDAGLQLAKQKVYEKLLVEKGIISDPKHANI